MCKIYQLEIMGKYSVVFLTKWQSAESSENNNSTWTSLDDEDKMDEALENMNFAEFKERYRRLIPYMTYFVANNYVNSQVLGNAQSPKSSSNYDRDGVISQSSQLTRKAQNLLSVGRQTSMDTRIKINKYQTLNTASTWHKQTGKFVPSIQYDPKDIGSETDYFTPVGYNGKYNNENVEYSGSRIANQYREYERPQQQQTQIYSDPTSSSHGIFHQDTRKYTIPSSRPYNFINERKYLPQKIKAPIIDPHQDYPIDYGTRISTNKSPTILASDYNYHPIDKYEPPRYIKVEQQQVRNNDKPTRILAQSPIRRPFVPQRSSPNIYPNGNNPAASLDDITKSLQLTNRLPEMLNNNNIDSSIRTLVEILSILHNAKESNFQNLPPIENFHQEGNLPIYNNFKETRTRPTKVITETRFQATPSPSLIHDGQTSRYRPEVVTYGTSAKSNIPINTNYGTVQSKKQENVIEYYTPLIQDIEEEKISTTYKTNKRPIKIEQEIKHTYEMNEDSADDIIEDEEEEEEEKYDLPITTEIPIGKYKLADGGSTISKIVPPMMTLKYGATRGKPNVDYPAYAVIPETDFNCKEQRYKGFFGDPSTDCQVWHYCDLNGGKSSFLCPNGTIFSQVALTCDWWFNVKCESTAQLYVLNERLYKYILPIMPKFPEDFSGPEVDRYLELKFKEMEAKLKEKKLRKQQEKDKIKEKLQGLESEE